MSNPHHHHRHDSSDDIEDHGTTQAEVNYEILNFGDDNNSNTAAAAAALEKTSPASPLSSNNNKKKKKKKQIHVVAPADHHGNTSKNISYLNVDGNNNMTTTTDDMSQTSFTTDMTDDDSSPDIQFDFDIISTVGGVILELVTFALVLYYNASLLAGGLMRDNFASLFYLLLFLMNLAFPSYYPYYPITTVNRILFLTPRVLTYVSTTIYSALFLITHISLQIVFKTKGSSFHPPHWLEKLGFVNLLGKKFSVVIIHILPDITVFISGILISIFLPILWRARVQMEKSYFEMLIEKSQQSAPADTSMSVNSSSDESGHTSSNYQQNAAQAAEESNEHNNQAYPTEKPILIAPDLKPRSTPNIFILKELLYVLLLMLTASMYPSLTSAPYLVLFFVFAIVYTTKIKVSYHIYCLVMCISNLYTGALILLFALSRYPGILNTQYLTKFGMMFGFTDLSAFHRDNWPVYTLYSLLIFFYLVTASIINQYICRYIEFRNYIAQLSTNKLAEFYQTIASSSTSTREVFRRLLQDFLSKFVLGLLLISLTVTALSVPSLMAMPYLLLVFLGLLVATDVYAYTLPVAFAYSILNVTAQFAFNIPSVTQNFIYPTRGILEKVGFRNEKYPSPIIFGQLMLTLLIGLTIRVQLKNRNTLSKISQTLFGENNNLISELNSDEYSYDSEATENIDNEDDDPEIEELTEMDVKKKERKKRPKTFRAWVKLSLRTVQQIWQKMVEVSIKFFTTYSYYLSLLVVYFADLSTENADTIHVVYLLFFLLFFVFKSLAKKLWILLVFYAQFVIIALYFFNVFYPHIVGTPYNILGLVRFRKQSFWLGLIWHILILFFTSIEYHVQNMTEFAGIKMEKDYVIQLPKVVDVVFKGFQQLSKVFGLYLTYIAIILLLLLSRESSLFGIVFFMILFGCFILQTYKVTRVLLYPFWYVLVSYSGLVFFAVYVYQFPDVRSAIVQALDNVPPSRRLFMDVNSIGLVTFEYKSVSLLPYTIVLLLSIFQLKNFQYFKLPSKKENSNTNEEHKSIMSELANSTRFEVIFSATVDDILVDLSRFLKRLAIIHQPKILFIFLFVAAQLNETMIGLVYFIIVILLAPVPNIASRLWLFIYVYASAVFLGQYAYQFPYFIDGMRCNLEPRNPNEPNPHTEGPHAACAWFKFGGLKLSKGKFIGDILWVHCLVMIAALFQKKCFQWFDDLTARNLYTPGRLFEEFSDEERDQQIEDAKKSEMLKMFPKGVRMFITQMWLDSVDALRYACNRLFEDFGYEVCMLVLLIGSLLMIQSFWGLLYLVLFGLCFFAGEKRMSKVWVILIAFMELNMIVLYFFKLEKFPLFDLYSWLTKWKGSIMFRYVILRPQDFAGGTYAEDFIISVLYSILFFMALQTRVYLNKSEAARILFQRETFEPTVHIGAMPEAVTSKTPASVILYKRQQEDKKLHVECPIIGAKGRRDFTESRKRRNWIDWLRLMVVFRGFPLLVLVVVFIDATLSPSFLKLIQMTICLFYLNSLEQLRWKSKRYWRWLGIFYYCVLILQALFQIPLVLIGDPTTWTPSGEETKGSQWAARIMNTIGLREGSIKTLSLSIVVLALFYIQSKIFDLNPDYLFFLNFLVRQRKRRKKLRTRNKTFRAAQIFRRYLEITFNQKRREKNMEAIKEYERINSRSISQLEQESKIQRNEDWPNDPKIIKEYLLRDHFISIHRSCSEDGTLSNKSEHDVFRIAFENIRNSKSLQDDIIERVDLSRMEELYTSSKKQLERQQRVETMSKKRSKSNAEEKNSKRSVKISSDVQEIPAETRVILEPQDADYSPQKEVQGEEESPKSSFKTKIVDVLKLVWKVLRGYIIQAVDIIVGYVSPFINIAYGNEDTIVELLTGSMTVSDQKSLLENREAEEKYFKNLLSVPSPQQKNTDNIQMDELAKSEPSSQPVPDPYADVNVLFKLRELKTTIVHLYLSNTDLIVYAAMVLNVVSSPTIYNVILTISAFIYAAMQYPFPPRRYWLSILAMSQALIALEYIFYLIQDGFPNLKEKNQYSPSEIIGWKPRSNLFRVIGAYLVVIFAVLQHRDTLKKRGDWYYAEESKKKALKKQQREEAIKRANEQNNDEPQDRRRSTSFKNESAPVNIIVDAVDGEVQSVTSRITWIQNICGQVTSYFRNLTNENGKLGKDYFVLMIAFQLLAFLLFFVTFSYLSGRTSTDITGAIQSNQLSGVFVFVLFLFFVEICIERIIYLYAKIWIKLVFHFLLVIVYHVVFLYMNHYVLVRGNTKGSYLLNVLYVIKCIYLAISCVQIRSGYPTTGIYSSYFAKSYFWLQSYIYLCWRAIPFVFELKTLLDWTFIRTTLNYNEWMKMEDVYSELYNRKCDLEYRKILGRNYGQGQFWTRKLTAGFLIFVVMCFLVFFPLAFYSTANPNFIYNSVFLVSSTVGVTGFQDFYENQIYFANPKDNTKDFYDKFGIYAKNDSLRQLDPGSPVQTFSLSTWSEVYWIISTPSKGALSTALLSSTRKMNLTLSFEIERTGPSTAKVLKGQQDIPLSRDQREHLAQIVQTMDNSTITVPDLVLPQAYNPFLLNKYDSLSEASVPSYFKPNCTIGIRSSPDKLYYWMMSCNQINFSGSNSKQNYTGPYFLIQSTMIVNGEQFYLTKFISGFGIIAFYTTFVLAVGQFLRMNVSGLVSRLFFTDVDNVDLLLSFVKDIYVARENGALDLEETMYVQLMRIFRDTSLLQVWTNINRSTL